MIYKPKSEFIDECNREDVKSKDEALQKDNIYMENMNSAIRAEFFLTTVGEFRLDWGRYKHTHIVLQLIVIPIPVRLTAQDRKIEGDAVQI